MIYLPTFLSYKYNLYYIYIIYMVNIQFGSRRHGLENDPASEIEMDSAYLFV